MVRSAGGGQVQGECECTRTTARGHLEAGPRLESDQLPGIPSPLGFVLSKSAVCWSWWEQYLT